MPGEWMSSVAHDGILLSNENKLLIHVIPCMNHKTIVWKGIKHKKNTYYMIPFKHNSRKHKLSYNDRKICSFL